MKNTKEMLEKENAQLKARVNGYEYEDLRVRKELSRILRYENGGGMYSRPEDPMTWIQIAFHMGELRADANYSCLIEGREIDRRKIAELEQKLNSTTNPQN